VQINYYRYRYDYIGMYIDSEVIKRYLIAYIYIYIYIIRSTRKFQFRPIDKNNKEDMCNIVY